MNSPILKLSDITKRFYQGNNTEIHVLSGASLELAKGEITALVAPSGSGKSTLLHIAGLLDRPDSGQIELSGSPMSDANDRARSSARLNQIGFVYQAHHLLPEFNALENVMLPQRAKDISEESSEKRARSLLDSVELSERMAHRPATLSGGEAQRVAIARALANQPKLLLADEPTGNLDPATSEKVFSLLISLARSEGLSALIATHNLVLAARMDRALQLDEGKLIPWKP